MVAKDGIPKYIAIFWSQSEYPIVYDIDEEEKLGKYNWSVCNNYAVNAENDKRTSMHIVIMKENDDYKDKGENCSIDHINEFKLDNRIDNLRIATQSQQNANRGKRSDKLPPPEELQAIGVIELPKYVRYDKTEEKFVIDKHPVLLSKNKKSMSGSKSKSLSIQEKYQDILFKLDALNKEINQDEIQFQEKKQKLRNEYIQITNCVRQAKGLEAILVEQQPSQTGGGQPIQPEMKTIPGRKKSPTLPPDCGVKLEEIPKYCYYRAANEKRGDVFIIERHPGLTEKRTWSSTSSKLVSTKAKFDSMMEVYNTLV